jgi:hypothetical protein
LNEVETAQKALVTESTGSRCFFTDGWGNPRNEEHLGIDVSLFNPE